MSHLRGSRLIVVVLSALVTAACASSTRSGRTGPRPPGAPPVGVMVRVIPCFLTKPIVSAMRHSRLEKYWKAIEAENEAPLRGIINRDTLAKEALASLDESVITPHKWTLTRYMVRLLRALRAADLKQAATLLRNDAYLRKALQYVSWDGPDAFDVVNSARAETLDLLDWLEDTRIGGGPDAEQTQKIIDRFLELSRYGEPYSVGGQWCGEPEDPGVPPMGIPDDQQPRSTSLT